MTRPDTLTRREAATPAENQATHDTVAAQASAVASVYARLSSAGTRMLSGLARTPLRQDIRHRLRDSLPLIVAAGLHALVIVMLVGTEHDPLGEPDGALEGVSVEIVDGATLDRRFTSVTAGANDFELRPAETRPADVTPPAAAQQASAAAQASEAAEAAPPTQQAPQPPTESPQKSAAAKAPGQQSTKPLTQLDIDEILASTKLGQAEPPRPKPERRQSTGQTSASAADAAVELSASASSSGETGEQRFLQALSKASLAHAGAVNEFARTVIRLLALNKPKSIGVRGRVVVQLIVTPQGEASGVRILESSRMPALDELVLDRVKSTRLAAPPPNTRPQDRTFDITYQFY